MPFNYPGAGAKVPAPGATSKKDAMSLKPYRVTINGYETTLLLSDEDAKRQGLDGPAEAKQAPRPTNKSRRASNKAR